MYTLTFRNEQLVLDWQFFLFDEFVSIWKFDKSKGKKKASNLLRFIYLLAGIDEKNPLKDEKSSKRETEAKFRAFNDSNKKFTDKELSLLAPAIDLYIKINQTPEERLLSALDNKSEDLANMLDTAVPETVTNVDNGVTSFVTNSKIITDGLSKMSKIRKNREKIIASIKNEAISNKVRGGLSLSPLIKGLIKIE